MQVEIALKCIYQIFLVLVYIVRGMFLSFFFFLYFHEYFDGQYIKHCSSVSVLIWKRQSIVNFQKNGLMINNFP